MDRTRDAFLVKQVKVKISLVFTKKNTENNTPQHVRRYRDSTQTRKITPRTKTGEKLTKNLSGLSQNFLQNGGFSAFWSDLTFRSITSSQTTPADAIYSEKGQNALIFWGAQNKLEIKWKIKLPQNVCQQEEGRPCPMPSWPWTNCGMRKKMDR